MIRKALVLVMSVVICCSFLYAFDSGVAYAVEGACSGVVSALVSQASEPRVSLQGVTFSSESPAIGNVSFVRSDVSTYRSSLRFFADTERSAFLDSIWSEMAALLADEEPFFFEEITEGDIILDGVVRLVPGERIAVSVSMLITGTLFPDSMVIEGDFSVALNEGGITIRTEDVMINGARYVAPDISLPIPCHCHAFSLYDRQAG